MNAGLLIRSMREDDIAPLSGVLTRAYGVAPFEWRLRSYLRLARTVTFVAVSDDVPVGMVVGNDYGNTAYVSQMAVDPALQRRGIAAQMMDALIAWVDARGFACTELDATAVGAPLYARFGFADEGETLVYEADTSTAGTTAIRSYVDDDRAALFACDAAAFGADRSEVLMQALARSQNVVVVAGPPGRVDGFAIAQCGLEQLGPVVAPNADVAAHLIDAARFAQGEPHRMHILSSNADAVAIVAARDYTYKRSLRHMLRGAHPQGTRECLYARMNLGQG